MKLNMKKDKKSVFENIRKKAEEVHKNLPINDDTNIDTTEVVMRKLIHELEVHQIELEMMNEEQSIAQKRAEEHATNKYAELYDLAPTGYFTLSKEGDIIELNLSGAQMLGKERSMLLNSQFDIFLSGETKILFKQFLENVINFKTEDTCKVTILTNDIQGLHVILTGKASPKGEQCIMTAVDISDYWLEHEKVKQSEEKYAKAFLSATYAVMITRIESGEFIEVNDAFCLITGYTKEEALANTSETLSLWADVADRNKVVKALRETGQFSEMEFAFRRKNGEVIIGAMSSSIVTINNEKCIFSSINDITQRKQAEEKLRISEDRYRNIFETVQDAYYEASPDGILLDISPSIETISKGQFTREEIIGKSFVGLYADPEARAQFYTQLITQGKVNDYELLFQNKDGSIVPIAISSTIVKDEAGNPVRITGSMRDISKRKKAENALMESKALYQSILNASPDDITITDLSGKVLYISPKALSMFGYESENQIIGRNLIEFIAPEDIEKAKQGTERMLNGNPIGTSEYKALRADNSIFDVEVNGEFIRDMEGNAVRVVYIVRDISNRKLIENKLSESELQYRILADSGQALIWTATTDKKCNYFNKVWLDFTGRTLEQELGDGWAEGVHPDDLSMCIDIFTTSFDKRENFSMTYRIRRFDGEYRWILDEGKPRYNTHGEFVGYIGNCLDITEIIHAENKLKQSEEKYRRDLLLLNSIFESPVNIIVFSLDTNYCYSAFTKYHTQTMKAIWGIDIQLGMNMLDIISSQEDKEKAKRNFDRVLKGDYFVLTEEYGDEALYRTYYENFYSPVKNNQGEIIGLSVFVIDATERNQATKRLEISEELFRQVAEQTTDFIAVADKSGFITYASPSSASMFRLLPEEMIGTHFLNYVVSNEIANAENVFRNISANNEVTNSSFLMKRADGSEFYGEINGSKFNDKMQWGLLVTIKDITERINAEKEILKFRTIADQANYGVFISDLEGTFLYVNETFANILGWNASDLIGKNFTAVHNQDQIARTQEIINLIKTDKGFSSEELYHTRKDGSTFPSLMSAKVIFDENNIPQYMSATVIDISERKKAEEELFKIYKAVEQSPVMTVITGLDGTIEYVNPAITKITGYSKDELIGRNPKILNSGETSSDVYKSLWSTILSGKEWRGEFHNKKKNGELYWSSALITPIFDATGKTTHYVSVDEDITLRKQIENELLELNANLESKVERRTNQLNELNLKLENDIVERIQIENDLRWNKSLLELMSNSSPLGFLVVDNRTDNILYFNKRFCNIWGIEQLEEQMFRGELKNNDIIPYCLPVLADIPAFAESCKPLQFEDNRVVIEDEIAFSNNRTVRRFSTQIRGENDEYFGRFYIFEDITERKQSEAALVESQQQFSQFMDYLPALVFIKDNESKMIYANNAMEIGLGVSEWIDKPLSEAFDNETAERILADDKKTLEQGYQLIEESFTNLDGKLHHYETQKFVIPRFGKEPLLGGVSLDITERKLAEILVEQTKQNYETFFNTIDDFLFVLDEQGNIIHVNNTVVNRLNYSKEELVDKSVLLVHPPERREEAGRIVGEMLAGTADFCPVPLITKSGTHIPVETRVKTGYWDGKPVIFGVSKDMSKIQMSEEKFSKAFQSNSASMAINSYGDGEFIDVNDTFVRTMGYSREELIGKTSLEVNLFESLDDRKSIYDKLKDNTKISELEFIITRKTGEQITCLFSAELIYVGDKLCILSLFVDITERKKAEEESRNARQEAEKANMAKSEFLSRMSHELRTPMNSILGFAQLLEMGELNVSQKRGVHHILNSGKHLHELINQVLDLSRIEAGRISVSIEPVELKSIFEEMMDLLNPLAVRNQIKFKLIDSPVNKSFVSADRQSFKQVLLNLLNNAIKYNKVKGVVEIKTELKSENDKKLIRISISDTGIGINQDDIKKLFVAFERIGADKSEVEGTGLGLAVVKKLMDVMDGSYGVESVQGVGSTFWVELPLVESPHLRYNNSKILNEKDAGMNQKRGTVLYIEDNISNIELIEEVLSTHRPSIHLITNMNGAQTLKLAIEYKPQLILLDLNLPDMNGSEVLIQLLGNSQTKDIPVVIISADAMLHQVEKLISAGAKKYLTKPLEIKELLTVIDESI